MNRSRLAFAALVAASATAVLPAVAAAADGPASGICVVKDVPGITQAKIKVGVNIDEASSKAADRVARCGNIGRTVRSLARTGAEMPVKVNGFRCTPSVSGEKVSWTCTWKGGSPTTSVELLFAWRYA